MDRIEAIDREAGLPFAGFFLMTHGSTVEPTVGEAIAQRLREARVRLPDHDAKVLLRGLTNAMDSSLAAGKARRGADSGDGHGRQ
jgi:hypothetical protein